MLPPRQALRLALGIALSLHALPATSVHADPIDPVSEPTLDPRRIGSAVASLVLDVPILDPDASYRRYDVGLGFSVQLVAGRASWPVMIGLGGGIMSFGGETRKGPLTGYTSDDGSQTLATTSIVRAVEVRHAELIVRVEPWWGLVRPYAEVAVGFGALWHVDRLEDSFSGESIISRDRQRDFGALFGATLGIDWRLYSWKHETETTDLILTTAARRWYTGPLERPRFDANEDGTVQRHTSHGLLAMWVPFIGLSVTLDNRHLKNKPILSKNQP